jgi:hypothetical protein
MKRVKDVRAVFTSVRQKKFFATRVRLPPSRHIENFVSHDDPERFVTVLSSHVRS